MYVNMTEKGTVFSQNVKQVAFDVEHQKRMMSRYDFFMSVAEDCANHYANIELEKSRAFNIRNKAFKNYDKLLVDFETNIVSNGGIVRWARDAEEAKQLVYDILDDEKAKNVVKTKSTVAEEIGLMSYLEMKKIKVTETDTGDFICYQYNERPSDMTHSAAHKSRKEISETFTEKFGVKEDLSAKQLMIVTRKVLNDKYLNADATITGADFIVADTGDIVMSENEGNVLKTMSLANVHIVLAGIDKLIPSIDDLSVLLPLSSLYEVTRIKAKSIYTLLSGPAKEECDRNKKLYVVLIDNRRSYLMEKEVQRKIFTCIECGACHSVCRVFNTVGGHVYDSAFPGPVGAIVSLSEGYENSAHLSTLCASCHQCEVYCPMNIKISDLILQNRIDIIKEDRSLVGEKNVFNFILNRVENRKDMDNKPFFKNFELKQLLKKTWGTHREIPVFAEKSFSQLWREIYGSEE